MKTSTNTADANSVGSTGGSAAATRERKWRIRISDCYCEYEYELNARANDVSIHDLYELVRERLRANDVHGRFIDPEENSPRMPEPPAVGVPPLATGSACLFCANERQLKPGCTRQRWKVCKDHFMITCPKCGHEGFWMENMKSGSYFACFSLDCNWRSSTPPNDQDQTAAESGSRKDKK